MAPNATSGPSGGVFRAFVWPLYDRAMAKHWVRYVMPMMVEVDDDPHDRVARVVTLPHEIREERDDRGNFMVYDEEFVRRDDERQPFLHAFIVSEPRWEYPHMPLGPPINWTDELTWESGFDYTDADAGYAETDPYDEPAQ